MAGALVLALAAVWLACQTLLASPSLVDKLTGK